MMFALMKMERTGYIAKMSSSGSINKGDSLVRRFDLVCEKLATRMLL